MQWDQRWGYHRYAGEVMGLSGCGPTALSMVAIFMTGDITKNPRWVADFASQNGYAVDGSGTAWSLMLEGARQIGLSSKEIPVERERVENNLQAGNPIIALMGPGEFTSNGHFIVLTGLQNGRLKINDPNSRKKFPKKPGISIRCWNRQKRYGYITNNKIEDIPIKASEYTVKNSVFGGIFVRDYIEERAVETAIYMIETKATVRQTA